MDLLNITLNWTGYRIEHNTLWHSQNSMEHWALDGYMYIGGTAKWKWNGFVISIFAEFAQKYRTMSHIMLSKRHTNIERWCQKSLNNFDDDFDHLGSFMNEIYLKLILNADIFNWLAISDESAAEYQYSIHAVLLRILHTKWILLISLVCLLFCFSVY